MKTVVDAVNDLRGDLSNGRYTESQFHRTHKFIHLDDGPWSYPTSRWVLSSNPSKYGTVEEFNLCVAEMTEGLFVPLSDLNKRKASGGVEILTDKDGNQYQKGAIYDFSLDGDEWSFGYIDNIDVKSMYEFSDSYGVNWRMCRVPLGELGTITKAPLVLEDGAAYQFDLYGGSVATNGIYHKEIDSFVGSAFSTKSKYCTNIVKLVPESK